MTTPTEIPVGRHYLHPWSGVLVLALLTAVAVPSAARSSSTAGSAALWLVMGAIAGFAVSGST